MLLTKLIPPESTELKKAVTTFNNFLELPNSNQKERLILTIAGGRGCCKSSIASGLVLKGCEETGCSAVCLRKHGESVRNSVVAQMEWASKKLDSCYCLDQYSFGCVSFTADSDDRPRLPIYCFGASEWESLRTSGWISHVKFVWVDSADEFDSLEDLQSAIDELPLEDNPIVILTFNPPADPEHWINKETWGVHAIVNGIDELRFFFHPCYLDVPGDWLGENFFRDAETMRNINEDAYRNAYLGWPDKAENPH